MRIQGGALDLHTESGLAALDKAGLLNEFKTHYRPGAELVRVVDNQAKIYSDEHLKGREAKFGDKNHRPEIDRGPLRNILSEALTNPSIANMQTAIAKYEKQMFKRFAAKEQETLFNTEWMHKPNALNDMLAMFSKSKLKQGLFISRYIINVNIIPFVRKIFGLAPLSGVCFK